MQCFRLQLHSLQGSLEALPLPHPGRVPSQGRKRLEPLRATRGESVDKVADDDVEGGETVAEDEIAISELGCQDRAGDLDESSLVQRSQLRVVAGPVTYDGRGLSH